MVTKRIPLIGSLFSGYIFDIAGSYYPAFTTYIVGLALGFLDVLQQFQLLKQV